MHQPLNDLGTIRFIFKDARGTILDNGYKREPISVFQSSRVNIKQEDEVEMESIDDSKGNLKVSKIL